MGTIAQPSGGWFQNGAMLVASPKGRATVVGAAVITLASLAGTGGIADSNFWLKRHSLGYNTGVFQGANDPAAPASRTPNENLTRIREILKPAVSDLATLFGVSRQTIYNWQAGEQPKPEYIAKLDDLAKAADIIASEGLANPSLLLKRKISQGKNLMDIVREGGSASEASQKLVQLARVEEQQRKALDTRLAGRKRPNINYAEIGVPSLDERA